MCAKSGRGWLTRSGVAFPYISLFLRGGGLNEILSKYMGVAYKKAAAYKSEYGTSFYRGDACSGDYST